MYNRTHTAISRFGRVLTLAACFGAIGCARTAGESPQSPPLAVKISQPLNQAVTDYADFTGRTAAVDSVRIRARVWGHLEKIEFKEGALVRKGDSLFVIDQRYYKAALAKMDADVAQSEARLARLERDHRRAQNLVSSQTLSREDFDKIAGDLSEAVAAARSIAAAREAAKLNLEFTQIKAPITGQISRAMVTVGNMVESGETGGTVLSNIVSIDPIYCYFDVDDQSWIQIRTRVPTSTSEAGPPVQLGLANGKDYPYQGNLDFTDNQVDAGTGTLRMRGVFSNKEHTLIPGMFVRVRVPIGAARNALLVTDRAIDTDQGQKVVFVVNQENVVEKRLVKLGGLHDRLREIETGVQAGDRIIVDGIQRVRAGMPVVPTLVPMPSANGNKETRDAPSGK